MALSNGSRFGSYEIIDLIGAGGVGEGYQTRDIKLNRIVAIKVLTGRSRESDRLERFRREARMLAALNHPHIAQVYGLEEHDGDIALAMELIDGQTLESVLRQIRG